MFTAKSTLLCAVFAISARLASAAPPACLLAAVNTQSSPADLPTLCGKDSSEVQEQIRDLCGDDTDAALDSYRSTCTAIGKSIPVESSSSKSSKPASATSKSTDETKPQSTDESTAKPKASGFASGGLVPYPITYTTTYFDNECSCTKTSTISSTDVAGTAGLVSATGNPSAIGFAGTSGGLGSGPGPSATGAPILPSGTNPLGLSGTGTPFTGAASNHLDNLSAGLLAIAGLALIL